MAQAINQISNFRNKVNQVLSALGSIKALLEADNQAVGKALARMRD